MPQKNQFIDGYPFILVSDKPSVGTFQCPACCRSGKSGYHIVDRNGNHNYGLCCEGRK